MTNTLERAQLANSEAEQRARWRMKPKIRQRNRGGAGEFEHEGAKGFCEKPSTSIERSHTNGNVKREEKTRTSCSTSRSFGVYRDWASSPTHSLACSPTPPLACSPTLPLSFSFTYTHTLACSSILFLSFVRRFFLSLDRWLAWSLACSLACSLTKKEPPCRNS